MDVVRVLLIATVSSHLFCGRFFFLVFSNSTVYVYIYYISLLLSRKYFDLFLTHKRYTEKKYDILSSLLSGVYDLSCELQRTRFIVNFNVAWFIFFFYLNESQQNSPHFSTNLNILLVFLYFRFKTFNLPHAQWHFTFEKPLFLAQCHL